MPDMDEIVEILQQQIINKTLNLEGITQVQKIIEHNKQLGKDNQHLAKSLQDETKAKNDLYTRLSETQSELSSVKQERDELAKKSQEFYEQSVKFKYEEKRGDELKEVLAMALRNPIITTARYGGQTLENGLYSSKDEKETRTVE